MVQWKTTPRGGPGLYWFTPRDSTSPESFPVLIGGRVPDGHLVAFTPGSDVILDVSAMAGRWYGPIPEPRLPETADGE